MDYVIKHKEIPDQAANQSRQCRLLSSLTDGYIALDTVLLLSFFLAHALGVEGIDTERHGYAKHAWKERMLIFVFEASIPIFQRNFSPIS